MYNAGYRRQPDRLLYYSATTLTRPNERAKDERRSGIPHTLKKKNIGESAGCPFDTFKKQKTARIQIGLFAYLSFFQPSCISFFFFCWTEEEESRKVIIWGSDNPDDDDDDDDSDWDLDNDDDDDSIYARTSHI